MPVESRPNTPNFSPNMSGSSDMFEGPLSRCPSPPLPAGVEMRIPKYLHHWKHYFNDEMVVFLVGNELFKVHRHFLARESKDFREMFDACATKTSSGISDEFPISLPNVTQQEFERLLDFFYEGMYPSVSRSLHFWVDILSISSRYHLERIRQYAIDNIDASKTSLDPVEAIVLSKRHDVPHWLPAAYAKLSERSNPLEFSESEKLGPLTANLISRAREALRPPGPILPPLASMKIINEIFFPPEHETPSPVDEFLSFGIFQSSEIKVEKPRAAVGKASRGRGGRRLL